MSDLSFLETQFIMSHTSFPGSFGKLLSPLSGGVAILAILATQTTYVKRSKDWKRLKKIGTEEPRALRSKTDANA